MGHIHEKIDLTAQAIIVYDGKVLLRMHDKYNTWLFIGGHIELDEDPVEALLREVKEECRLEIELLSPEIKQFSEKVKNFPVPHFMDRMFVEKGHEHVDMLYVAKAKTFEIIPSFGEKDVEFKWFTSKELLDPKYLVKEHIQYYACEAIRLIEL